MGKFKFSREMIMVALEEVERGEEDAFVHVGRLRATACYQPVVKRVVAEIFEAAEKGEVRAQIRKALCLGLGLGRDIDIEQAEGILSDVMGGDFPAVSLQEIIKNDRALSKENEIPALAAFCYGAIHFRRFCLKSRTANLKKAVEGYKYAAGLGYVPALCQLAFCCQTYPAPHDVVAAYRLFRMAAKRGSAQACYYAGCLSFRATKGLLAEKRSFGNALLYLQAAWIGGVDASRPMAELLSHVVATRPSEKGMMVVFEDKTEKELWTHHEKIGPELKEIASMALRTSRKQKTLDVNSWKYPGMASLPRQRKIGNEPHFS